MLTFTLQLHSLVRWLVVLMVVLGLIRLLTIWISKREFTSSDNSFLKMMTGMVDLQFLIGVVLLILWIVNNTMGRFVYEHAGTNLIAIALLHIGTKKWKNSPAPVRARNTFFMILIAAALIGAAVARLPQGWTPTATFW